MDWDQTTDLLYIKNRKCTYWHLGLKLGIITIYDILPMQIVSGMLLDNSWELK